MSVSRRHRAAAMEAWADRFRPEDLVSTDNAALRKISELSGERDELDLLLAETVDSARCANRLWTKVGSCSGFPCKPSIASSAKALHSTRYVREFHPRGATRPTRSADITTRCG